MSGGGWRWSFAYALDRRVRSVCWANAVSWALRRGRFRDIRQDQVCKADAERNGECYCGKVRSIAANSDRGVTP